MPGDLIGKQKEPLDDESLRAVKAEFERMKKGTPYKRFSIGEFVDNGAYAKVYKVTSLFSGKVYAMRIAENQGEKTRREIEAVRKLMARGQGHIVNYLMDFTVQTRFGIKHCTLMDFLCPLSSYENTADDIEIAVRCGNDLLPLLQACMNQKILHRDIKPENILYDMDFRNEKGLMLSDFGEARTDFGGTVTGRGTPSTMSPEIHNIDENIKHDHHLSDLYSLGIVMYYYLNGRVYPFDNNHTKRVNTKGALPEPRNGSKRLKRLVVKATQYYPKDRFASPREMLKELQQCEEYKTYILGELSARARTAVSPENVQSENERLRRQLEQQNRTYRAQLAVLQAEIEEMRKKEGARSGERPSDRPSQRAGAPSRPVIQVGRKVRIGQYPQGAHGEMKPLMWRVLAVENRRALLITDKLIDCVLYNLTDAPVTWETCTLRKWMNHDFMNKAFSSSLQTKIDAVTNQNPDNPKYGTSGGNPTGDRIFALSIEEAKKYFLDDDDRVAVLTEYAEERGSSISENPFSRRENKENHLPNGGKPANWWLRSPGYDNRFACSIMQDGGVSGFVVHNYLAVRPAMWLNL